MKTIYALLLLALGLVNPFQKADTNYYLMVPESFSEDTANDIRYITFNVKEELPQELDIYELNDIFSDTDEFLESSLSFHLDDETWAEMGENRQINLFVTKDQYDIISYLHEKNYPFFVKTSTLVKVEDFKIMDKKGNFYSPSSLTEAEEITQSTETMTENSAYYFKKAKKNKDGDILITVENAWGQKRNFYLLDPTPKIEKDILSYKKKKEIYIKSYSLGENSYVLSFDNAAG